MFIYTYTYMYVKPYINIYLYIDLVKCALKEGHQVMLMGTADVIAEAPEKTVFLEDMTDLQKAEKGAASSAGLDNLGNTCYMNATVQCFRGMKDLKTALSPVVGTTPGTNFSTALRDTFNQLDNSGAKSVVPYNLVSTLRRNHPQFAETGRGGNFMQQDAEEFLNIVTMSVTEGLNSVQSRGIETYDKLLGITFEETFVCQVDFVHIFACAFMAGSHFREQF
jgi:uncharacterized UBP type Zn finger protein